jgi:hypothetical protein
VRTHEKLAFGEPGTRLGNGGSHGIPDPQAGRLH